MLRLVMSPGTGGQVARYVGDRLRVTVRMAEGASWPEGWRVLLRTNLGRARALRREIIHSYPQKPPLAGAAWHDVPLFAHGQEWSREITLAEPGFFRAKAYAVDPQGRQHWPEGPDVGIAIHPDGCRTGNIIYSAFVRMFGSSRAAESTSRPELEQSLAELDEQGFTVIPPSGKLRDLVRQFPHIFGALRCRILQLLPVTPVPTTFARFGRFGSPYAVQDLTAVDPALVEFDKRSTGLDQFRELTYEAHRWGGRVFLDIPINHTGWGATLQEQHPEWYLRDKDGAFVSPGAWGVTWEDLVELNHVHPELWENLAEVFLTWCRRGVDGFRCDAGYKIPVEVWRYITARVRDEFPDTVFLLEGLGGSWEATEALLTEGGMQWAYSELFQNYTGAQVAGYLDYCLRQSQHTGLYVHYSETHDNNRLAAQGRVWSLMRNRLCALASASGGYGFTCGVEWLATEKINVHASRGMRWGRADNIVAELARLNDLLREHPCFHDGAKLTRLSPPDSPVYALRREAGHSTDSVLVLVNMDTNRPQKVSLALSEVGAVTVGQDLLGQAPPAWRKLSGKEVEFSLSPAGACCLEMQTGVASGTPTTGRKGDKADTDGPPAASPYAAARARAAWAVEALCEILPAEEIGAFDWRRLAAWVAEDPARFFGSLGCLDRSLAQQDLEATLKGAVVANPFPQVVCWRVADRTRVAPVPPNHWLLLQDSAPFRATLTSSEGKVRRLRSVPVRDGHAAGFPPLSTAGEAVLELERYADDPRLLTARLQCLERVRATGPSALSEQAPAALDTQGPIPDRKSRVPPRTGEAGSTPLVLLTNGRGAMARLCVDLGRVISKYDCLLGANLHPSVPTDRHVLAKRVRAWVMADGFLTPLNGDNLAEVDAGPPARWRFLANAGDGRAVEIELTAWMWEGRNSVGLRFHRPAHPPALGRELPTECHVSLTVRIDLEDRNFHSETHRNGGADHHFANHCRPLAEQPDNAEGGQKGRSGSVGFGFAPAAERQLRVSCDRGVYHHEAEWSEHIPHPLEATRGLVAEGDAFSPGWFEIPLGKAQSATLLVTAEKDFEHGPEARVPTVQAPALGTPLSPESQGKEREHLFARRLANAIGAFVVRRDKGKTVIAGYPWFLDWGRDTLIAARGLLAAGKHHEVGKLLQTFGRFEERGTLPNLLMGDTASNRDTSDAPLWYGVVCEEWSHGQERKALLDAAVAGGGRTLADVLGSVALHYCQGTSNGIHMDPESGLIWSPSHFTWMDTNHPAGTPREGYPVEIQVLWIRLLRLLERLGLPAPKPGWHALASRAEASLKELFWLEKRGWLSDVLLGGVGTPARAALAADWLRPNCLFAVSFGLLSGERARRCVAAAQEHLLVPGALRSLAPLPAHPPLPIHAPDGRLLNDPAVPYWGRYEGDEDTRRKPAYHNGTAWTWLLPTFCEALVRAWDFQPPAVRTAQAHLAGLEQLMDQGCLGHLPELLDGDAPHTPRGCDAQAWSVTEALRVWKLLESSVARPHSK